MHKLQNTQLAIELEGTPGTAETLVAGDAILVNNPKFVPDIQMYERDPVTGSFSPVPSIPGMRFGKISFEVDMCGASSAGVAPHYDNALQACGLDPTIVAVTSVTYAPLTTSAVSATVGLYEDGKLLKKIWGAKGTVKFIADLGKPAVAQFEFTGKDFSITDSALLVGVTYDTTLPQAFQGITATIAGYEACFTRFELDPGNVVVLRRCASSASGYETAMISNRKPMLKLDPEETLVATEDFYGIWRAGTPVAFSTAWGTGAGSVWTFEADAVQYQNVQPTERDGLGAMDINALCTGADDDEFTIALT